MDKDVIESCYTTAAFKALERFPVDVEGVEFIKRSENVTFRVSVRGRDTDYVLRLHRPGYNTIEELNSERVWVNALQDAGIPVPGSLMTQDAQNFVLVDIPEAGEQRYAGMTTWLQGTPLDEYLSTRSDAEERKSLFRRIGELAAAIHNQSANWKEPAGFEMGRLDVESLLGETPYWGRFWEHAELTSAEKALLLREREKARTILIEYGESPETFSLIHADLHPENIIYNEGDLALIDFDDAAYSWHLYEIATALILDVFAPDYAALRAALLEGYCEHRPLSKKDLDLLDAFLTIRGMAIIGWFHQRAEHAGSEYFAKVKEIVFEGCLG